ncbi:MAG TPA: quinone-dependent dihydroorotate dehydrogenase [Chryseolinea sp.]|nr:quinone-dependent dihydroorotate dehydrogenase [Chryseolinea sp.]
MYTSFVRRILFLADPEKIHHFVFSLLSTTGKIPGFNKLLGLFFKYENPRLERVLFGVRFKNPVGLAAGFDKDARLVDEMAALGFGFIEIGTLTPKPQPGNDRPRLFRLPDDQALVNRMGFNNQGVDAAVKRLRKRSSSVIVGGNIGKNKSTPNEKALDDYVECFKALEPYVDYFVVNVSSPNTPGLRALQEKEPLQHLMSSMKKLALASAKPKPVLLKIAPDLNDTQLDDVVDIVVNTGTDGIIATNTTVSREGLRTDHSSIEQIGNGGLSGKPLGTRSTEVIRYLRKRLGPDLPIIGVGGIMRPEDAIEKLNAGANLVQLYTGFIYEGPAIARRINEAIIKEMRSNP